MAGVPRRSPCDDGNRQNDRHSDSGKSSKADFPILTIPHAALHVSFGNPDFKRSLQAVTFKLSPSSCLGEHRQDAVDDVDSNDL
jgi:hypothetical protein